MEKPWIQRADYEGLREFSVALRIGAPETCPIQESTICFTYIYISHMYTHIYTDKIYRGHKRDASWIALLL